MADPGERQFFEDRVPQMTSPLISRTGSDSEGGNQNKRGNDDVIDSYDSDGMENWD